MGMLLCECDEMMRGERESIDMECGEARPWCMFDVCLLLVLSCCAAHSLLFHMLQPCQQRLCIHRCITCSPCHMHIDMREMGIRVVMPLCLSRIITEERPTYALQCRMLMFEPCRHINARSPRTPESSRCCNAMRASPMRCASVAKLPVMSSLACVSTSMSR